MGQLRVVPKVKSLQFAEVQGVEKEPAVKHRGVGVVLKCGNIQVDIPPETDPHLLELILGILGDQSC